MVIFHERAYNHNPSSLGIGYLDDHWPKILDRPVPQERLRNEVGARVQVWVGEMRLSLAPSVVNDFRYVTKIHIKVS